MDSYRVLLQGGEGEIVEKKSRFIATVAPCATEEEALRFIEGVKKKYWDARHNCSAFVIGGRGETTRCSDDGEPSGTAGRPILEVLLGAQVRNVAVVVTRYFGGVLLGTGGLARAYTRAAQEGLARCVTGLNRLGCELEITTDYNGIGRILHLLGEQGVEPEESEYADVVRLRILIPVSEEQTFCSELTEATFGRARIRKLQERYYIDRE
ncbi:MAG: YigZ family protein [Clostridium sp.]|nr:YigZ family protein [Acetatifactor muris]MCM1527760.1 YigZ family protein [Bacteroides sp.]MCM1563710.1 YigZ family protein [Clostridium sp.]